MPSNKADKARVLHLLKDVATDPSLRKKFKNKTTRKQVYDTYGLTKKERIALDEAVDENRVNKLLEIIGAESKIFGAGGIWLVDPEE